MNKLNKDEIQHHSNIIGNIIERMANNHFKWYMAHIASFSLFISLYSLGFKIIEDNNRNTKIVINTFLFATTNLVSFVMFWNSWNYLKMERSWREMQGSVRNGNKPSYNWKEYKPKKKLGFVFWTEIAFLIIIFASSITFFIVSLY